MKDKGIEQPINNSGTFAILQNGSRKVYMPFKPANILNALWMSRRKSTESYIWIINTMHMCKNEEISKPYTGINFGFWLYN